MQEKYFKKMKAYIKDAGLCLHSQAVTNKERIEILELIERLKVKININNMENAREIPGSPKPRYKNDFL
jgi:hypothetical protein